ncbi:MAG: AlpA family phage regulatory protein [Burkholderiales bacterium]|nr:MAG: AlpA family phage regulatory protein [Burkholderiales bacterium]
MVGIDEAQHRRGGAGKTQLVGEHVADQTRAFPKPVQLGGNVVAWPEDEIEHWISARLE